MRNVDRVLLVGALLTAIGLRLAFFVRWWKASDGKELIIDHLIDDAGYYAALVDQALHHTNGYFGHAFYANAAGLRSSYPMLGTLIHNLLPTSATIPALIFVGVATSLATVLLIWHWCSKLPWNTFWKTSLFLLWTCSPLLGMSWYRPVSPQINYLFFVVWFYCWWQGIATSYRSRLLQGLTLGILWYVYPFYWTYALVVAGLVALAQWKRAERRFTTIIQPFIIAFAVAAPALIYAWLYRHAAFASDTFSRLGLLVDRRPAGFLLIGAIIGTLAAYAGAWRANLFAQTTNRPLLRWSIVGLVAGFAVLVQPIITARQLELSAHYAPLISLYLLCGWWTLGTTLAERYSCFKKGFVHVLLVFAAMSGLFFFTRSQVDIMKRMQPDQDMRDVIAWLQTQPPTTVDIDQRYVAEVIASTDHTVLFAGEGWLFRQSNEEQELRARCSVANHAYWQQNPPHRSIYGHTYTAARDKDRSIQRWILWRRHEDLQQNAAEAKTQAFLETVKRTPWNNCAPFQTKWLITDRPMDRPGILQPVATIGRFQIYQNTAL